MADVSLADFGITNAEEVRERRQSTQGFGTTILNELVKSYGFKVGGESGFEWSVDNIRQSFKEDPFWTTLDYVALLAAPAKMGVAALRAGKATNTFALAHRAGAFGAKEYAQKAATRPGRFAGRAGLSNPIGAGRRIDPEVDASMRTYGYDAADARGVVAAHENERLVQTAAMNREAEGLMRDLRNLPKEVQEKAQRFLEDPLAAPGGTGWGQLGTAGLVRELGEEGAQLYEKTWHLRNAIHEDLYRLGAISRDTYSRNLRTYAPRLYEEFLEAERQAGGIVGGVASDRFKARTVVESDMLTRVLSPEVTVAQLAEVASVVTRQQFVQGIATSAVVKNVDELGQHFLRYADDPKLAAQLGISQDMIDLARAGDSAAAAKVGGWVKFEDLAKQQGGSAIPGYISRLPQELRERWVDPAAAEQVMSSIMAFQKAPPHKTVEAMKNAYWHSMGFFRAGKTAYNPATHFRNFIGNIIFHNLATSQFSLFPKRGIEALTKKGRDYTEALNSGVLGTSFSTEIREATERFAKGVPGIDPNGLQWLGESKIAQHLQRGAGKLEDLYRAEDEWWKLDAFIRLRDKGLKKGMDRDQAIEWASGEVAKYMPSFMTHSPVGDVLRKGIPFASFTTEALRVWKNAILEKPAQAFMWNHMAESMTQISGAVAGMDPDEIEEARAMLPHYQQGKKMALLPFRIDGKPSFLDMSYMIPMANLPEAGEAESLFFGALYDPSANPVLNVTAAAVTGVDPFTKRKIGPDRFERTTGIAVEGEWKRRLIGMGEHMAAVAAPPLLPPGYAGVNIAEWASNERHADTGLPLEPNFGRMIASNLAGLRTYEATPSGQTINIRKEGRERNEEVGRWRQRYKRAVANNDREGMRKAERALMEIKESQERGSGRAYIERLRKEGEPGTYRTYTTAELTEAIKRIEKVGTENLNTDERRQYRAMKRALRERKRRRRR